MSKRLFDILWAGLTSLILLLPLLLMALWVRATSKGPALYWSARVGRNNVLFDMPNSHHAAGYARGGDPFACPSPIGPDTHKAFSAQK